MTDEHTADEQLRPSFPQDRMSVHEARSPRRSIRPSGLYAGANPDVKTRVPQGGRRFAPYGARRTPCGAFSPPA